MTVGQRLTGFTTVTVFLSLPRVLTAPGSKWPGFVAAATIVISEGPEWWWGYNDSAHAVVADAETLLASTFIVEQQFRQRSEDSFR